MQTYPEGLPDFGEWLTSDLSARPSMPDRLQATSNPNPRRQVFIIDQDRRTDRNIVAARLE